MFEFTAETLSMSFQLIKGILAVWMEIGAVLIPQPSFWAIVGMIALMAGLEKFRRSYL